VRAKLKFTYEDYRYMPDDKRCELMEGELVMASSPVTTHQRISGKFEFTLGEFVQRNKLGGIFYAPLDVVPNYEVREYWLVDPDKQTIEVMVLGEEGFKIAGVYSTGEKLQSLLLAGLSLNPGEIFG